MKKYIFLYAFLAINMAMSGYAIWQNHNLKRPILYLSYDLERVETKIDELDEKVEKNWSLTSNLYMKIDRP
ncbi:hypothetical protein QLH32_05075 [Acinetobacter corruptisaponis]|uniref:Uncharacterized protein n=1 Tax=Acinetobacter corruptisaponis TaxID=3045147 RepID=A0ABY8S8N2_9GAMM|nr:hypothetical protein [Acinetobacter sp. KCTC 92772]WHP06847.1 hypothetical protein QLH32_05075 [Acinetobacter sp. KCTC 92772]